ncbi:MAG: hypothetical protein U1F60_03195 [Planctomycetota bacterium]
MSIEEMVAIGIVGPIALFFASAAVRGFAEGCSKAIRQHGWFDLLVGIAYLAWKIAAIAVLTCLLAMLLGWLCGWDHVQESCTWFVGYAFWPVVLGFPLLVWVVVKARPETYDAG